MLRSLCEEVARLVPDGFNISSSQVAARLQDSPLFHRAVLQLTSTDVEVSMICQFAEKQKKIIGSLLLHCMLVCTRCAVVRFLGLQQRIGEGLAFQGSRRIQLCKRRVHTSSTALLRYACWPRCKCQAGSQSSYGPPCFCLLLSAFVCSHCHFQLHAPFAFFLLFAYSCTHLPAS
jgi:hypothetical protein